MRVKERKRQQEKQDQGEEEITFGWVKIELQTIVRAENFPFLFPFTYLTFLSLFSRGLLVTSLLCFPLG